MTTPKSHARHVFGASTRSPKPAAHSAHRGDRGGSRVRAMSLHALTPHITASPATGPAAPDPRERSRRRGFFENEGFTCSGSLKSQAAGRLLRAKPPAGSFALRDEAGDRACMEHGSSRSLRRAAALPAAARARHDCWDECKSVAAGRPQHRVRLAHPSWLLLSPFRGQAPTSEAAGQAPSSEAAGEAPSSEAAGEAPSGRSRRRGSFGARSDRAGDGACMEHGSSRRAAAAATPRPS